METLEIKIGEKYPLTTFEYFEYLDNGGEPENFVGKTHYDGTLKATTPTGSYIIEINEVVYDEVLDSMFYGKEIKEYYPELELDDNIKYCVTYSEDCPFYD
jgi:hypothetical protein